MVLTATLSTHADTLAQLPLPGNAVVVGVGEVVAEVVCRNVGVGVGVGVGEAVVVGCDVGVVEVVVIVGVAGGVTGVASPDTGQMFPRTAVIHEEPTWGYCQASTSTLFQGYERHTTYLPNHDTSICEAFYQRYLSYDNTLKYSLHPEE